MLCKDNWIDISWDGLAKRVQTENLQVTFNKKAQQIMPFDLACDVVAQEIYSEHKKLYVTLSGGCDSENVANAFYRNNIPFTPLILMYDHVMHRDQQIESWFAFQWCKNHNIEPLVLNCGTLVNSLKEKESYLSIRPRLYFGNTTSFLLAEHIKNLDGKLVTGSQLEYYPDYEQMTYLEPQLKDYVGFVMEESDYYLETNVPDQHPWAFHYWSPEVLAAFVNEWDTELTMQENKAKIYKVTHRPKIAYPPDFLLPRFAYNRDAISRQFGTIDCALLGTKQSLLEKLVK